MCVCVREQCHKIYLFSFCIAISTLRSNRLKGNVSNTQIYLLNHNNNHCNNTNNNNNNNNNNKNNNNNNNKYEMMNNVITM